MSGAAPDGRSGYKLIPQSNSENSEYSDEELYSFSRDGFQIITQKKVYPSKFRSKGISSEKYIYSGIMDSERKDTKINNILPAQNQEAVFNGNVMSRKQKFSLSISIFVCFLVIGLFLNLPCEWADCSCSSKDNVTHELWHKMISNIELKGPIILVCTPGGSKSNFLVMARGSIFADAPVIRTNYTSSSGGDILAFDGLKGDQIWRKHFNKMPSEIDCALFSVRNRLPNDCVIVSYGNYVTVVSPETGRTFWNLPLNTRTNRTRELFPVIVPDIDGDSVLDLIMMKDINKILLVSGSNGTILSTDFDSVSWNCSEIKNLRLYNESFLKLSCKVESEFTEMQLPIHRYLPAASLKSTQVISQHCSFSTANRMHVHGYSIQIMNEGDICPKNCKSKVLIRNLDKKIIWSHEAKSSYVMTPVSFNLNYSVGMYGFVIKIWEYEHEDMSTKKLKLRSNDVHKLTVSFLYERIVVVVFNSSFDEPIQTVNMSYVPIIQLHDANKSVQPDPVSQQHSLTLADVGGNGSQQIITYYSTFEDEKRDNFTHTDYTLKSYIRLYDLEKEIL